MEYNIYIFLNSERASALWNNSLITKVENLFWVLLLYFVTDAVAKFHV